MTTVLITGANGFIGTRLAEVAVSRGYDVVGLIRNWSRTARVARVPIRLVQGDVLDRASLERSMQGCESVIHCATDFGARGDEQYRSIVEGTANVVEMAARSGLTRIVHVSTAAVHGLFPTAPILPEQLVTERTGIPYCDGKIDAEWKGTRLAEQHGLPLVIVRPTIVFGPWGTHDAQANQLLCERRMVLVDGANGHFNGIYIDNLVDGLLSALSSDEATGRIFHLTDDTTTTWRDFIETHASAVDETLLPLPETSREALRRGWEEHSLSLLPKTESVSPAVVKQSRQSRLANVHHAISSLSQIWRTRRHSSALPGPRIGEVPESIVHSGTPSDHARNPLLTLHEADMFRIFDQVTFRADSAREILGFRSHISFADGMERTIKWIRWRSDLSSSP
jgi:nucleoside-diphosphate-sugar epimerase